MMYKSPIDIIHGELELKLEDEICKAVRNIGIVVDKDELIKALKYDRDQYDKGWRDCENGIVHCKDCVYFTGGAIDGNCIKDGLRTRCILDFCSRGEMKRLDNADRCVCCGDVIPEGRQVCPKCEGGTNART